MSEGQQGSCSWLLRLGFVFTYLVMSGHLYSHDPFLALVPPASGLSVATKLLPCPFISSVVKEPTQVHDSHSKIRYLQEPAELIPLSLDGEPSPQCCRKPCVEALETGRGPDKDMLILNYRATLR